MFWLGFGICFVIMLGLYGFVFLMRKGENIEKADNSWQKYAWTIHCPKCGTPFRYGFHMRTWNKDDVVEVKCAETVVGEAELKFIERSK